MSILVNSKYRKGGHLEEQEKDLGRRRGNGEIMKVKIEGDICLSLDVTWDYKTLKTTNVQVAWIQASAKAFILKNSHHGFINFWLVIIKSNVGYTLWWNGGTLQEMCIRDGMHQPNANIKFMGSTEWQQWDQVERF